MKTQNHLNFLYTHLSLLDDDIGKCSDYLHRGLVCRLFASAASKDKHGRLNLATCKIIKIEHDELYLKTEDEINRDLSIPVFSDYYMKLSQIDFRMSNILLPINRALKMAIEEVLNYYAYRPYPHGIKSIA